MSVLGCHGNVKDMSGVILECLGVSEGVLGVWEGEGGGPEGCRVVCSFQFPSILGSHK